MCGVQLRQKKIYRFDVHAGFERNYISVDYGKQCSLVWTFVLRALNFEVEGKRKKQRLKRMWKKQAEGKRMTVGLNRKDALCRSKWSVGVNKIAAGLRCTLAYCGYYKIIKYWCPSL